ncbi:hypothetical protein F2P81_004179 [Scophthalmus maximus]|uniref:Uncharacterized protein n=1 Tax=Scophthalmus maximus TaxID=52904 RepID=A0A6A4TLG3_SCOMX|nr:hypothetical protein F2P81_004179 [Scophthalmus maximus]
MVNEEVIDFPAPPIKRRDRTAQINQWKVPHSDTVIEQRVKYHHASSESYVGLADSNLSPSETRASMMTHPSVRGNSRIKEQHDDNGAVILFSKVIHYVLSFTLVERTGIKNLSRRYCHSGIDHILGSRKIGNVCACAVTCLDSRQRDGGELSRLLSVHGKHGQCLFVCLSLGSVCLQRRVVASEVQKWRVIDARFGGHVSHLVTRQVIGFPFVLNVHRCKKSDEKLWICIHVCLSQGKCSFKRIDGNVRHKLCDDKTPVETDGGRFAQHSHCVVKGQKFGEERSTRLELTFESPSDIGQLSRIKGKIHIGKHSQLVRCSGNKFITAASDTEGKLTGFRRAGTSRQQRQQQRQMLLRFDVTAPERTACRV